MTVLTTLLWSDNANETKIGVPRVLYASAPPGAVPAPATSASGRPGDTACQPRHVSAEPPEWLELQLGGLRLELDRLLDRVESESPSPRRDGVNAVGRGSVTWQDQPRHGFHL